MIKIRHDIKIEAANRYYLNDIRVWFGQISNDVHVGTRDDCSKYMSTDANEKVFALAKSLISKTGKHKIDLTDPMVKKFLEVTKCI